MIVDELAVRRPSAPGGTRWLALGWDGSGSAVAGGSWPADSGHVKEESDCTIFKYTTPAGCHGPRPSSVSPTGSDRLLTERQARLTLLLNGL